MILAFGGIPLLYMGDEIGLLNDDSYLQDPNLAADNRWLHRPRMDWALAEKREDGRGSTAVYSKTSNISSKPVNTPPPCTPKRPPTPSGRTTKPYSVCCVKVRVGAAHPGQLQRKSTNNLGISFTETRFWRSITDHITGKSVDGWHNIQIEPYGSHWLQAL